MIEFKEGTISNVVVSTILGHSGRGMFPYIFKPSYRELLSLAKETKTTILTKSSTRYKKIGNYVLWFPWTWRVIRNFGADGMINAFGLTNDGVLINAGKIARTIKQRYDVIPNYHPELFKGWNIMVNDIGEATYIYDNALAQRFKALELNISCPNIEKNIKENIIMAVQCVRWIKMFHQSLVLIAKISIAHPYELAQELEKAGVDVIHAVNSVPYNELYLKKRSPLHKYGGGGVSGGPAFKPAFDYNSELRKKVNLRIIMGGGIMSLSDAEKYFDIGADAISICTLIKHDCEEAVKIIKKYNR